MACYEMDYSNVAEVGDVIRAYDFEPRADIGDRFIEGTVTTKGFVPIQFDEEGFPCGGGYQAFTVLCEFDSVDWRADYTRVNQTIFVPFEFTFDWEGRVVKI